MYAPTDGKTTEELVPQALALCDGRETTVLDLLGVQLQGVLGEFEALLHKGSKLTDAAPLLTQDLLGVSSTNDNLYYFTALSEVIALNRGLTYLGAGVGDPDITTRVTLLRQLAGEEIVELRAEDTVGDELALLADLSGHF